MKKRRCIELAYGLLGISAATGVQIDPGMYADALVMLNSMMAKYSGQSVRVGYNLAPESSDDQNQEMGTPDTLDEPFYYQLAVRLAPTIGKQLNPAQLAIAQAGEVALQAWSGSRNIPQMQFSRQTPVGGGNKPYRTMPGQYMQPQYPIGITGGTDLDANGEPLTQ